MLFKCAIAILVVSFAASAEVTNLKITSFILLGQSVITSPRLGEVCGNVTGDLPAMVTIISDPGTNQGSYTTLTDSAGNFCQTLATNTGRVEASASSLR